MMRFRASAALALTFAAVLAACGGGQASSPSSQERGESAAAAPEGEQAPGGIVTAMDGTAFDLAEAYDDSSALVIFYRGHW